MFDLRLAEFYFDEEKAKKLISDIKSNPGCCDTVWLCTLYGFPPTEKVKEAAQRMKSVGNLFRGNGIRVSMQISNTLGHSDLHMKYNDFGGLVFEGTPVERMVGENGAYSDACYCPGGEYFRNYIYETTKIYSELLQPESVWVDDDLRIYNHRPVNHGCFCDRCMNRFNKKHGTNYSREQLVYEINHGDIAIRREYIEQNRQLMSELSEIISTAVHEVSPDSHMAYQSSRTNSYLGFDFDCIFEPMHRVSGKNLGYRPGGGFYNDYEPRGMLEKALHLDTAISVLPEYVDELCPEVENTPDVVFGKSFEGTAKEATLYLAYGCNSLSFAALSNGTEADDYNHRLLAEFSKYSPFWKKYISHNNGTACGGVGIYTSPEGFLRKLSDGEKDFAWDDIKYTYRTELASIGIPITNFHKNAPALLLYPEASEGVSEKDMEYLASKPVICDARALEILYEKGFGKYFGAGVKPLDAPSGKEVFTAHEANGKGAGHWWAASMFTKGTIIGAYEIFDKDGKTEPLGDFVNRFDNSRYGTVNAIVNTYDNDGKALSKWAVFGYSLWETVTSTYKRNQIIGAIDYICKNTLPARLLSAEQVCVIPRADKDGKTVSVSLQSISIGRTGDLTLLIRNPKCERFEIMGAYRKLEALTFEKCDDGYLVNISQLDPYEMITVFC